jgi:hypothetical protein
MGMSKWIVQVKGDVIRRCYRKTSSKNNSHGKLRLYHNTIIMNERINVRK